MKHCPDCGRIVGKATHVCATVELKGPRHCSQCSVLLRNDGWERYAKVCGRCNKKKIRALERAERKELRRLFGDCCLFCGYADCPACLHFHHLATDEKYTWNVKGKTGASIREIRKHPSRFILICSRCHGELHYGCRELPNDVLMKAGFRIHYPDTKATS